MVSVVVFLRETRDELKKVVFPKREEALRLTIVVILISMVIGLFLGGIDFALANLLQRIVK